MDAYCPHLGANLALGGRVEGCNLVCPYHWWEYDGDGRNVRIPYSDRTNTKARVRSYPAVDVNGFVMFWYHPDPQQAPLWDIPDLPEYATDEWTEPIVAEWNVRCPWQELAENGPDFVHLKTVHGAATVPEVESITYDGVVQPHPRPRRLSRRRAARSRAHRHRQLGSRVLGVARFTGIIDTVFFATTTPIDWEWTQSIKVYRVKKLGRDAEALERTRRVGEALVARSAQADGRGQRDLRQQDPHREPGARRRRRADPPVPQVGGAVLRVAEGSGAGYGSLTTVRPTVWRCSIASSAAGSSRNGTCWPTIARSLPAANKRQQLGVQLLAVAVRREVESAQPLEHHRVVDVRVAHADEREVPEQHRPRHQPLVFLLDARREAGEDVAAVERHAPERLQRHVAAHRVERDVDAAAVGRVEHRFHEVGFPVVDRELGAELEAQLRLLGRSRGREHARPACTPSWSAAEPAPPAPAWTSSVSPACTRARS